MTEANSMINSRILEDPSLIFFVFFFFFATDKWVYSLAELDRINKI